MSLDQQVSIENATASFHKNKYLYEFLIANKIEEVVKNLSQPELAIQVIMKLCATPYVPTSSLLSMLRNYDNLPLPKIAKLLEEMVKGKLITISRGKVSTWMKLPQDKKEILDSYNYPLPLVIEPMYLHENTDSAYYTKELSLSNVTNLSVDLINIIDINLDHLNQMNRTPLELGDMLDSHISMPPQLDDSDYDYKLKLNNLVKYFKSASNIYSILCEHKSIYLTHYYDKRGRIYCKGFHVSYQGSDWNKSLIHIQTFFEISMT